MEKLAVSVQNLSHRYPGMEKPLLANLDLHIAQGTSFGLFGPNGAGKTTLISLITGLISYQNGKISILGKDMKSDRREVRKSFGYVPQSLSFYEQLSPLENLDFFGSMMGLSKAESRKRAESLLEILGLSPVKNKMVSTFSGGMKRRVNLAIGVIHEPSVIFLDEPTVGVDVQTRHAIIEYLRELNAKGTTLFYTSHHLSEAEELCDRVALMDEGKILVHDNLSTLLQEYGEKDLEALFITLTGKAFRD